MKVLDRLQGKRVSEAEYLTYTHKHCPGCDSTKVVTAFYRKTTKTARGWAWDSRCIECRRAACREYGASNKERRNERLREWRKANPELAAAKDRRARLQHRYGITEAQVEALRASQNGRCAICDEPTARLFVDHCHERGHVRGLLCQTCNTFLGWYENKADAILRFQRYLDSVIPLADLGGHLPAQTGALDEVDST